MNNFFKAIFAKELTKLKLPLSKAEILNLIEFPADSSMGDVAFPCFRLSKTFQKPPHIIANDICASLQKKQLPQFRAIEAKGGYVNAFFDTEKTLPVFCSNVAGNTKLMGEKFDPAGKLALIEHTSINPNASPHIGRARNALIGDSIKRLLLFLGYKTEVHYFVNDIGKQISLLVRSVKGKKNLAFKDMLDLYIKANEELENNPQIGAEVLEQLNKLENGNKDVLANFKKVVTVCINGIKEIMAKLGIEYDRFVWESDFIVSGETTKVLEKLKKHKEFFTDEEQRYVVNLEKYKINGNNPYLPLTRADKTSLYPLRDICYATSKAKQKTFKNIIVLGEDQKLYGRQINACLDILGEAPQEIVNYSFVLLPTGKMSTRQGNVVLLEDFMDELVLKANEQIKSRTGAEDLKLAKILGYGALKYCILKSSNDKNVLFDLNEAVSFEGDTSLYIQYAYSRICSLLQGIKLHDSCDFALLAHPREWELCLHLSRFTQILDSIQSNYNFSSLANYVYQLAQKFSKWYNECPISKNVDGELKNARLWLANIIKDNIKNCLYILGIEVSEKI